LEKIMPLEDSPKKFKDDRYDLITVDVAAPGAGLPATWNVPANRVVAVVGITVELYTSEVVADRWLYACIRTGGAQTMLICPVMRAQVANTHIAYYLHKGIAPIDLTTATPAIAMIVGPLTCAMQIKYGESVYIVVQNMDADDYIEDIRIRYYEWEED